MHKVAGAFAFVILLGLFSDSALRADRPGSYDRLIPGPAAQPDSGRHHSPQGPMRHGYRWPINHRSLHLYVGTGWGYASWPVFGQGVYYPAYPAGNYAYWGPAGIYFNPASNYAEYYLPPTYMPAELAYGPLAVERFLGVRRAAAVVDVPAPPVDPLMEADGADVVDEGLAARLRTSNASSRDRAGRFLAYGDALFAQQRFHEASQRYKSAIEAAPDLAQAYIRQGFAWIAVKQYRLAAKALRIAVELDPGMPGGDFQLDHLYQDNRLAKTVHLEQLSGEALARSDNGDLLFLVGMFLFCDGDAPRAQKFLRKASDLGGPGAAFLLPLLERAAPPAAVERDKRFDAGLDI